MRPRVVLEIALMTFRDFVRTPEAVFWTYGFPLIMALALGFAFSRGEIPEVKIAVADIGWVEAGWSEFADENGDEGVNGVQSAGTLGGPADLLAASLERTDRARIAVEVVPRALAEQRLVRGEFDVVVLPTLRGADPDSLKSTEDVLRRLADGTIGLDGVLRYDPTRTESDLARAVVELALDRGELDALRTAPAQPRRIEEVIEPGSRYIDFIIPGLIGLNLLGSGLFGIGFNLVQMRVNKMLRRLAVTPMRRSEFLGAFLLGRLILTIPETAVVLLFGRLVFDVPLPLEAIPLLFLVTSVGALTFCGIGVLIASRARTIEAISGLMNLAMVPMWLLGGCFFSVERFPDVFWPLIAAVPMYWFTEATRDVLLSGAGFADIGLAFAVLVAWSVGTFVLAVRLFRWQ